MALIDPCPFNETLTNGVVSFEQPGPDLHRVQQFHEVLNTLGRTTILLFSFFLLGWFVVLGLTVL